MTLQRHTLLSHRGEHLILRHCTRSLYPYFVLCGDPATAAARGFEVTRLGVHYKTPEPGVELEPDSLFGGLMKYTHSLCSMRLDRYGSLAGAVFYPVLYWRWSQRHEPFRFILDGWAHDPRASTRVMVAAFKANLISHATLRANLGGVRAPSTDEEDRFRKADREWELVIDALEARGFNVIRDKYDTSAYGDIDIADLELVEAPPPTELRTFFEG